MKKVVPYSHRDPEWAAQPIPFDAYAAERDQGPVRSIAPNCWFISQRAAVVEALETVDILRADLSMEGNDIPTEELFLSEIPNPRHADIRRLYNVEFRPLAVARYAPFVDDLCNRLIEAFIGRGTANLVTDYVKPIPSAVIAHVIGVPESDAQRFMAWSDDGLMQTRQVDLAARGVEAELPLHAYIEELIDDRRRQADPPGDVVTRFLRAEIEGEALSTVEIRTQVQFVVGSAVETTRKLIANIFSILLDDPDLYQRLRHEPKLAAAMVEETMRFLSPVQATVRKCTRDTEIAGTRVAEGDTVVVGLGSANRDDHAFDDPELFQVERPNAKVHVGFGAGPHVCPGAHLARLEATMAIEVFCRRVQSFSRDPAWSAEQLPVVDLRQPEKLPVVLVPA